jgi:secondary thiamine-phosphate synthase enzyme
VPVDVRDDGEAITQGEFSHPAGTEIFKAIFRRSSKCATMPEFKEVSGDKRLMKTYRKELWFNTQNRRQYINITPQVKQCLAESGIKEGLLLCNAMHITASVFINDDEPGLHHDFEVWLEKLAPEKPYSQYQHNGFEDNADAHLKRSVMGREVVVAVTDGKLDFGPWEQIFYGEFDGKRRKRVLVKIIGE